MRNAFLLAAIIFGLVGAPASAQRPAASCCGIIAIDARTGIVTAKVTATGNTFQFKVTDTRMLRSLRVSQGVYANFSTRQVSLDGTRSCCAITSGPTAAAPAPARAPAAPPPAPPPPPPPAVVPVAAPLETGQAQGLAASVGNMTTALPIPLGSYAQGQAMMAQAAQNAALLDIHFTFLNKTYENDQYVRDPITRKRVRTSCIRFKATSGFQFKVDVPQFTLNPQGLTVVQNIAKIKADGLSAKFQLGLCQDIGVGVGVQLTDVKVTYRNRPMVTFSTEGACTLHWNQDTDDITVAIGDLNILGVQNDIDKLAKDAVREAINAALEGFFGVVLKNELVKISAGTCGGGKKK